MRNLASSCGMVWGAAVGVMGGTAALDLKYSLQFLVKTVLTGHASAVASAVRRFSCSVFIGR